MKPKLKPNYTKDQLVADRWVASKKLLFTNGNWIEPTNPTCWHSLPTIANCCICGAKFDRYKGHFYSNRENYGSDFVCTSKKCITFIMLQNV